MRGGPGTGTRTRGRRGLALVGLALGVAASLGPRTAEASPRLELRSPGDRSVVRGAPARIEVAAAVEDATALGVEVDGELRGLLLPWSARTQLELEPGLHRVNLVGRGHQGAGRGTGTDAWLRSAAIQVAVFEDAASAPIDRRARNGWTAAFAFVIAVGGAARLRHKGELKS